MQTPTEFEVQQLLHVAIDYDPAKAHDYYEKHKKLKGRKRGQSLVPSGRPPGRGLHDSRTSRRAQTGVRAKQRQELASRIKSLSAKLAKLEAKIREMEHKAAGENRKAKANKERAAKEKDKPKTAAEKAKAARESKKFREQHKQELKNKAKQASGKSGGGPSDKKAGKKTASISELKTLATKVKGQIAVAKQKLAAL